MTMSETAECTSKPRHCWHIIRMGMTGQQINRLVCCHCGQELDDGGRMELVPHGKFLPKLSFSSNSPKT